MDKIESFSSLSLAKEVREHPERFKFQSYIGHTPVDKVTDQIISDEEKDGS